MDDLKKKVIVIPADDHQPLRVEELTFYEIARLVAGPDEEKGFVESVSLPRGLGAFHCNEHSKFMNLPRNERATRLATELNVGLAPDDFFGGDVCIVGSPDKNGERTHVPTQLINAVVR